MPNTYLPTIPNADVAKHNSSESCYVIIGAVVHDVTDFISDHPGGGELILQYGGKDVDKIMANEDSHEHSESAYEILRERAIGIMGTGDVVNYHKSDDGAPLLPSPSNEQAFDVKTGAKIDIGREIFSSTGLSGLEHPPSPTDAKLDYEMHKFLDLDEPLLMQLWRGGFSKDFYLEQVHRPRHVRGGISASLLGNFLEPLSLTPFWVVPLVWLPCVAYGISEASAGLGSTVLTTVYCLLGFSLWSPVEYILHRWLGHVDRYLPDNRLAITAHFLLHGMHHYLPMDKYRTVMPPALFILSATPFLKLSYLVSNNNPYTATAVFCGGVLGYIQYELIHYYLHQRNLPTHFRGLKKYHLRHHYEDYENGYGITSRFWDEVFGTALVDRPTQTVNVTTKAPYRELHQPSWDAEHVQESSALLHTANQDRFRATTLDQESPIQSSVRKPIPKSHQKNFVEVAQHKWYVQAVKRLTASSDSLCRRRWKMITQRYKIAKAAYFASIANACTIASPVLGIWLAPFGTAPRPDGYKRVFWSCGCGNRMYADMQEEVPEAVEKYAFEIARSVSELKTSTPHRSVRTRSQNSGLLSRTFNNRLPPPFQGQLHMAASGGQVTSRSAETPQSSAPQQSTDSTPTQTFLPDSPTQQDQSPSNLANRNNSPAAVRACSLPEKRFLLLCMNIDKYLISLKQINITNLSDDQFLFFKIRQAHKELRGRRLGIFSLMIPTSVEIIKFELVPLKKSTPCVGVLESAYPPPQEVTSARYHYIPCPINLKPPICANVFMHAFFHPGAHTFQFWLNRLPKKLSSELIISDAETQAAAESEPRIGWGIHIIEGLNWFCVTCMMIGLLLCTGIIAVVWSVARHGNLQEGFGIGQYLVAVEAAIMSALIIKWTS